MRPVRIGVQLPEVERLVRWPEYAAMARAAEEVGFDSVWVGDHLLYRGNGRPERGLWDAWTLLAGHWADAGIGAGGAFVLVGLGLGATRAATNVRSRHPRERAIVTN